MQEEKDTTVGTADNAPPAAPTPLNRVGTTVQAAAAEPVTAEADQPVEDQEDNRSPTKKAFDEWMQECIYNSPLSEHTVSYNYLLSKLPELEAKLGVQ